MTIKASVHPCSSGLAGRLAICSLIIDDVLKVNSVALWQLKGGGFGLEWPCDKRGKGTTYPTSAAFSEAALAAVTHEYARVTAPKDGVANG